MADASRFRIEAIELFERPVHLCLPFRFGVVTLREAPQAFVRARIALPDGKSSWGAAAELMAPKWFDKNLQLSNDDNFAQLRDVLRIAPSDLSLSYLPLAHVAEQLASVHAQVSCGHTVYFPSGHGALADLRRLDEAEAALAGAILSPDAPVRRRARTVLGDIRHKQGRDAEAVEALLGAFAEALDEGDLGGAAAAVRQLGLVDYYAGRLSAAEQRLGQAAEDNLHELDLAEPLRIRAKVTSRRSS